MLESTIVADSVLPRAFHEMENGDCPRGLGTIVLQQVLGSAELLIDSTIRVSDVLPRA